MSACTNVNTIIKVFPTTIFNILNILIDNSTATISTNFTYTFLNSLFKYLALRWTINVKLTPNGGLKFRRGDHVGHKTVDGEDV
jgi:hypothetical protein